MRTEIYMHVPSSACTNIVATAKVLDGVTCAPNEDTEMVSWLCGWRSSLSARCCVMKEHCAPHQTKCDLQEL